MKVFDCFTFFNELDLLEFRLRLLNDYVDHFIIAESNLTFNGKNKPYNFEASRERFKEWENKITYLPVKQTTEGLHFENDKSYNPVSAAWKLENEQRNALGQVSHLINDEDLVLVSDLDEIPDPAVLRKLKPIGEPVAFSLLFHYYYMNCQNTGESRWWQGCVAASGKMFKEITPQGLRNNRDIYRSIKKGGWHFSFLGGAEKISYKIQSYAHTEYNQEKYYDIKYIEASIKKGEDILKRKGVAFKLFPLSYYPLNIQKVMRQYPDFLLLKPDNIFKNIYFTLRRIVKGRY